MWGKACNILITGRSSLYKQYDLNYIEMYTTDQTIKFDRGEWGSQLCTVGGGHC